MSSLPNVKIGSESIHSPIYIQDIIDQFESDNFSNIYQPCLDSESSALYEHFQSVCPDILKNTVYMLLGNGLDNQFRTITELVRTLYTIQKKIPKDAYMLYFGDIPNEQSPDIGYAFELLSRMRPDIQMYTIQSFIKDMNPIPFFVNEKRIFRYDDLENDTYSEMDRWSELHRHLPNGISKVFVLGGGEFTIEQVKRVIELEIPVEHYPIERRYIGDGVTAVKDTHSKPDRFGPTYEYNW